MKIVLPGGAGAMAFPAAIHFLEQKDVTKLRILDTDKHFLDERIAMLNDERVEGKVLDLMDVEASAEMFSGFDVIYNCAFKTTCSAATEAALQAGVNYLDLGGFDKPGQISLSGAFEKKGLIGICGVGTATGMSNIMSAYGVRQLDDVESIRIVDACVDIVPDTDHSRPLYWGFAIENIIDEFVEDSPYFDGGQLKQVPAMSYPEVVNFRPPAGPVKVATTVHSEPISLSETFKEKGLKHASWKIGFEPDFEEKMNFVKDLGLLNEKPIEVDGQMVSPRALFLKLAHNQPPETKKAPDFRGHMMVIVKGKKKGQTTEYRITEYATEALTHKMQNKGVFSSYRSGLYGAIGALMIGRGQIEKKGVFYPEACVPPEQFLREAARAGIEIEVSRRTLIED